MKELGNYLKSLRKEKNLSIRRASKGIGLSHTYLDSLEKGYDPRTGKERKPTPEALKKIAKYYEVPYLTLLRKSGYFGENKKLSNDDWEILNEALSIEEEDEISLNKIGRGIASGKVFTLQPDERLTNYRSKQVSDLMQLSAFLLYYGPEQWGTEPFMRKVNEILDSVQKRSDN